LRLAYAHTRDYSDRHGFAFSQQHSQPYTFSHTDIQPLAFADRVGYGEPYSQRHPDKHGLGNTYRKPFCHRFGYPVGFADAYAHRKPHRFAYRYRNGDAFGHGQP
jgi:hypothetical protein